MNDIESRIASLELMFSKSTTTGLCTALDKKLQTFIGQRLIELEGRIGIVMDSKVDGTDFYVNIKNKIDKNDFEKILAEVLHMKEGFKNAIKTNNEIKEEFIKIKENQKEEWKEELKDFKKQLKNLRIDFDEIEEYFNEQRKIDENEYSKSPALSYIKPQMELSPETTNPTQTTNNIPNPTPVINTIPLENSIPESIEKVENSEITTNKTEENKITDSEKNIVKIDTPKVEPQKIEVTEFKPTQIQYNPPPVINNKANSKYGKRPNEIAIVMDLIKNIQTQINNSTMNVADVNKEVKSIHNTVLFCNRIDN